MFSCFCSISRPVFAMSSSPINNVPVTGGPVNSSGVDNNFAYHVTAKLTDDNFLLWKQQIEPVLKVHHLQRFVVSPLIPPKYLTQEDADMDKENPAYAAWEYQDQSLLVWLQSSLSEAILSKVVGCVHAHQVWEKIHNHFQAKTKAKSRYLHGT